MALIEFRISDFVTDLPRQVPAGLLGPLANRRRAERRFVPRQRSFVMFWFRRSSAESERLVQTNHRPHRFVQVVSVVSTCVRNSSFQPQQRRFRPIRTVAMLELEAEKFRVADKALQSLYLRLRWESGHGFEGIRCVLHFGL